MSQSAPLPTPDKATVAAISPPARKRAGFWTGLASGAIALLLALGDSAPDLLHHYGGLVPDRYHGLVWATAIILGLVSANLHGWRGTNSAARVKEELDQLKVWLASQGVQVPPVATKPQE